MENRIIRKQLVDYKIGRKTLFYYTKYIEFKSDNTYLNFVAEMLASGVEGIELDGEGLSDKDFLKVAKLTKQLCAQYDTTFIIKNRADIAYLSSADCVNLEQDALDILSVREVIGGEILIGSYINSHKALDLVKDGADYINVCQISSTPTEPVMSTGLEYAKWVSENTSFPVIISGSVSTDLTVLSKYNIKRFAFDNSILKYTSPNKVTVNLLKSIKKESYN